MIEQTGVRSGLLLFVLGLWVVMRTVNQDGSGRTLIDHILGKKGGTVTNAAGTPAAPAAAPATRATATQRPTTLRNPNPVGVPAHGGTF